MARFDIARLNPLGWADKLKLFGALGLLGVSLITLAGVSVWGFRTADERDWLLGWADNVCTAVGEPLAASKGHKRGEACRTAINRLINVQIQTVNSSNIVLKQATVERVQKTEILIKAVKRADTRRAKAVEKAEAINAAIQDDRVDDAYFGALSELAGLRPPAGADAPAP